MRSQYVGGFSLRMSHLLKRRGGSLEARAIEERRNTGCESQLRNWLGDSKGYSAIRKLRCVIRINAFRFL